MPALWARLMFSYLPPQPLPVREALLRHLQLLSRRADFLLDQVILNPAGLLRGIEDLQPRRVAFPEGDGVAASRASSPVFAVDTLDSSWIRIDPCDGIRTHLHTGPYQTAGRHL